MKLFTLAVNRLNYTRRLAVAGTAAAVLAVGLAGSAQASDPWKHMSGDIVGSYVAAPYSASGSDPKCTRWDRPEITKLGYQSIKFHEDLKLEGTTMEATATFWYEIYGDKSLPLRKGEEVTAKYEKTHFATAKGVSYRLCVSHDHQKVTTCTTNGTFCGNKRLVGRLYFEVQ